MDYKNKWKDFKGKSILDQESLVRKVVCFTGDISVQN